MFSLSACESESAPSTRALRSPTETGSAENEMLGYEDITPLAVVGLPNGPDDHIHVTTILDPLLGRVPPAPTGVHPTIPVPPVTTGIEIQPTTTTAPAPTTAPARGAADSTTRP